MFFSSNSLQDLTWNAFRITTSFPFTSCDLISSSSSSSSKIDGSMKSTMLESESPSVAGSMPSSHVSSSSTCLSSPRDAAAPTSNSKNINVNVTVAADKAAFEQGFRSLILRTLRRRRVPSELTATTQQASKIYIHIPLF